MTEAFTSHSRTIVEDLALVLMVAAITTVICRKLRQPVVLGYIIAGLIVGPHIPIPLFADIDRVHSLSELGVILVMFAIGLEFSFRKLVRLAPTAGIIAFIQILSMMWLGYLVGQIFGWTLKESLYAGAMIAISSTMIIAKAFSESQVVRKVNDLALGILIFEDLVAVLLITFLTAFSGENVNLGTLLHSTTFQLLGFLLIMVFAGFFIVPRSVVFIAKLNSPETLLVATVGVCFAFSFFAQKVGYSVALGAFIAGALVAESGKAKDIEDLVQPVRDLFAAIFFVSVGMLVDPSLLVRYWAPIVVLTLVVIAGKFLTVSLGGLLTGNDVRTSVQTGMSLAQIGEFSFIIAASGLALKAIGEFLYPVAIAVSVITTFITPWLIRSSGKMSSWIDEKLPQPIQTFITLYASWIERLQANKGFRSNRRRMVLILIVDAALLVLLIIGTAVGRFSLYELLRKLTGLSQPIVTAIVLAFALLISIPFLMGIVRASRGLARELAERALPPADALKTDLAEAPRSLMLVSLEYGIVLILTLLIVAITQPFLPAVPSAVFMLAILIVAAILFWQRAANLQGHVHAGGQIILEALAGQTQKAEKKDPAEILDRLENLLPGLGSLYQIRIESSHSSVGKSLSELNIHSLTGATIIAIIRQPDGVVVPGGSEKVQAGDILAAIGTTEAVTAAKELLSQPHENL